MQLSFCGFAWQSSDGVEATPSELQGTYASAKEALRQRFEPESKRELYAAEFRARTRSESWGDLSDALRLLVDRPFPDLEDAAREKMALDRFLGQLDNT